MALIDIDIDIDDYLDEAGTSSIINELKKRKVNFLDFIGKIDDDELIQFISVHKKLTLNQAEKLKETFKNF